ncbi:hypothetical protein M0R45_006565 [Rubus argutus]|uniref:Uncharacterized protein n=1 Tax=Rubus argutus TaxID=59490 RepID=A0AAW1YQQ4_RUBAR
MAPILLLRTLMSFPKLVLNPHQSPYISPARSNHKPIPQPKPHCLTLSINQTRSHQAHIAPLSPPATTSNLGVAISEPILCRESPPIPSVLAVDPLRRASLKSSAGVHQPAPHSCRQLLSLSRK